MRLGTSFKVFMFYLSAISLLWIASLLLLWKKASDFRCQSLLSCLVLDSESDKFQPLKQDAVSEEKLADRKDETKNENKEDKKKLIPVGVVPESGTLILYDQATDFSLAFVNKNSVKIELNFYLAEEKIKTLEIEPNGKQIVPFKIHPFESHLSWEIHGPEGLLENGYVDILRMDKKSLQESLSSKRNVMVLK